MRVTTLNCIHYRYLWFYSFFLLLFDSEIEICLNTAIWWQRYDVTLFKTKMSTNQIAGFLLPSRSCEARFKVVIVQRLKPCIWSKAMKVMIKRFETLTTMRKINKAYALSTRYENL